jgi:hypothetical protein
VPVAGDGADTGATEATVVEFSGEAATEAADGVRSPRRRRRRRGSGSGGTGSSDTATTSVNEVAVGE